MRFRSLPGGASPPSPPDGSPLVGVPLEPSPPLGSGEVGSVLGVSGSVPGVVGSVPGVVGSVPGVEGAAGSLRHVSSSPFAPQNWTLTQCSPEPACCHQSP